MKVPEDQLRIMIDQIPTLAWSCRPDGTTDFLNQRWLDYTGLSSEQALGWGRTAPIHPGELAKLMDTWRCLLTLGEPGEEEARLRRFDGEYLWFLFRAVPVRHEQGRSSDGTGLIPILRIGSTQNFCWLRRSERWRGSPAVRASRTLS